ncbi:hypothetical protein ACWEPC_55050, partial [Nonomuraea sp. NPDC004297]
MLKGKVTSPSTPVSANRPDHQVEDLDGMFAVAVADLCAVEQASDRPEKNPDNQNVQGRIKPDDG